MRTVLLTGATGFLGASIGRALLRSGVEVVGVKRRDSNLRNWPETGQVRWIDAEEVETALSGFKVEGVIHAATCYGRNGESAGALIASNVTFPLRIAAAAAAAGCRWFINLDTTLPAGVSDYALSKSQWVEWLVRNPWKFAVCNLKLEHLYGPGDDASRFVQNLILRCLRGESGIPLTLGEQRRDFLFVEDATEAVLLASGRMGGSGPVFQEMQVGTGQPLSIREVAEKIAALAGARTGVSCSFAFGKVPYRKNEVMHSSSDSEVLRSWGWMPRVDFEQGLSLTIDSILSNRLPNQGKA